MNFSELKSKEIIRVEDGKKLGYVEDLIIDENTNRIIALKVPKLGRVFKKTEYISIEVSQIQKIGENVILIADEQIHSSSGKEARGIDRGGYCYSPKVFKRLDERSKNCNT